MALRSDRRNYIFIRIIFDFHEYTQHFYSNTQLRSVFQNFFVSCLYGSHQNIKYLNSNTRYL